MSDDYRETDPARQPEDMGEGSLRPETLADFTGQKASRENLAIFIEAVSYTHLTLPTILLV